MSFSLPVIAGLVIVLIGLLIGHKDIVRFSLTRSLAVASVAFRQSIRRRVLLILPPVMLAIIAVNQFQVASDARDAIRQTTNLCLMATGLLATLVQLMAACTSIPREIDNRVIYTITTKPITRLEILLGKVIGFSGVSLLILGLMGLFSWGFLKFEDQRLKSLSQGSAMHAEVYSNPLELSYLGSAPDEQGRKWLASDANGEGGSILIPFRFNTSSLYDADGAASSMTFKIPILARTLSKPEQASTRPAVRRQPRITLDFRNIVGSTFLSSKTLFPNGLTLDAPEGGDITFTLPPDSVAKYFPHNQGVQFFIAVTGQEDNLLLNYTDKSTKIFTEFNTTLDQDPDHKATYIGPRGKFGYRMRGDPSLNRAAFYSFKYPPVRFEGGKASFEFQAEIEPPDPEELDPAQTFEPVLNIRLINSGNGQTHDVSIKPDTSRPIIFDVPASILDGGQCVALLQSPNANTWFTFHIEENASLRLILESQTYAWNLAKSLFILWLFLVLVTIISVSSSTFLSWPIAITFTIIVLICRYAYLQLGDLAKPGLGNTIVSDLLGNKGADVSRAVSTTVDALANYLNAISSFLPDISQYSVMEELNMGAAVSMQSISSALIVTGCFGLPILILGWIFLRQKEVAP